MDKIFVKEKAEYVNEVKELTIEIQKCFTGTGDKHMKWSSLKTYYDKVLLKKKFGKSEIASYVTVLSALLDALEPSLFFEKWHETLFDKVFLQGIHHEAFLILVQRLDCSKKYILQKVINLLMKFVQSSSFEALCIYQCISHEDWNLNYVSKSNFWDDLIASIISLPERIANVTKGKLIKIFIPTSYMSLLLSSVFKVLGVIHEQLKNFQDCSLEFLAKLIGKMCIIGNSDIVARKFSKELINLCEADFVWRRIMQNFISKMPSNSLDAFITNLLIEIPWYGYVEWILGDQGIKNEKINYIMTVKLLFFRPFKQVIILQNTIGYFASSPQRACHFTRILDSLLDSWVDERALRHQSIEQKTYLASALMICAGWIKHLKIHHKNTNYIAKMLEGTQIRLGSSEDAVRSLGLIVGESVVKCLDPDSPPLEYEFDNKDLIDYLKSLLEIPSKPSDNFISNEDFKCFEEVQSESKHEIDYEENQIPDEELDSDDDLEPYDMSNDIPQSKLKHPLYLRDCMAGLIEQKDPEWTEQCMKHAEELIKANPYAAGEVAEEMAKIMLHLADSSAVSDFVGLRHSILIALAVQCPLVVANYLISRFTARDYTIRQRLDILEVLATSSVLLSSSDASLLACERSLTSDKDNVKRESNWQLIINQRLEVKTKRYTKAQKPELKENKFSAIAGNFFYPLLNSYEKACKILKLHDTDSYLLGSFINTLAVIMYSASNTLHCSQMGTTLLQFLSTLRSHKDVFVRQSVIYAAAATFIAVPPSLLFQEMYPLVADTTEWLKSVALNDPDANCVEKALYTLSIFENAASEGSVLYHLKSLKTSN